MRKINIIDKIILYKDEIELIASRIKYELREYYKNINPYDMTIFVISEGANVFASDLREEPNCNPYFYIKAKSYEGTEQNKEISIEFDLSNTEVFNKDLTIEKLIANKNILIIDDIYDTGNTLYAIIEEIKKYNPVSIECCVLLDRINNHEKYIDVRFVGKKIKTKDFLIGYGLDYNEEYRYLDFVATINKEGIDKKLKEDIICNLCGKSCIRKLQGEEEYNGLLNAKVSGDWMSIELDSITYKFDLCEKCIKELFEKFKFPPEEIEYDEKYLDERLNDRLNEK